MNPFLLSSAMNFGKKNPLTTLFIVLAVFALLLFIYIKSPFYQIPNGLNKMLKKSFEKGFFNKKKDISQIETSLPTTISEAQAERLADSLHEAMDGFSWTMDYKVIQSIFNQMQPGDLVLVSNKYGKRRLTLYHFNSLSLIDNLRKRLSDREFDKLVLPKAQKARLL